MNKDILRNFFINFIIIIGINILFGLQSPRINNIAHAGGFMGGAGISVLYFLCNKNNKTNRVLQSFVRIVIVLCIGILLIFWPRFYTFNYFNTLDPDKKIIVNGYTLKVPEMWEIHARDKEDDIIIDSLTGNKILIFKDQSFYSTRLLTDISLEKEMALEIETYLSADNYGKDYDLEKPLAELNNGWYSFELVKKSDKQEFYDFITFYNKSFGSSLCRVMSFTLKKYSSGFDELLQRVLESLSD